MSIDSLAARWRSEILASRPAPVSLPRGGPWIALWWAAFFAAGATKRAAAWGYMNLYWYRDGIDAWEAARLPTAAAEPASGIVTARKP